jgi:hypothetical protein
MKKRSRPANFLLDLENRQEEVIARLEELDKQVERVLTECLAFKAAETLSIAPQVTQVEGTVSLPVKLRKAG